MSVETKTTVSDYINAMFKMADNMEQPCEQDERRKALVAANELKAAWERERAEIAARAATDAVNLTNKKWMRDCANVAKLQEALEKVHGYLGKLIRDGLVEDAPEASDLADDVWDALHAAPVRNCDVGGFAEQQKRFVKWCYQHPDCEGCIIGEIKKSGDSCELIWAQMKYEAQEGGEQWS